MTDAIQPQVITKLTAMIDDFTGGKKIEVMKIKDGFVLDIPTAMRETEDGEKPRKRKQFVYVTAGRKSNQGEDIYQIFTICAPEDERFYRNSLLLNMNLPFGAIAVSNVEGKNYFVLVDTYLCDDVSQHELESSIMTLAKCGDRIEEVLIGEDVS